MKTKPKKPKNLEHWAQCSLEYAARAGASEMKTIKIIVTKTDIQKGKRDTSNLCPVAKAIRRCAGLYGIDVYGDELGFGIALRRLVDLPKKVSKFVERFDFGKPVKPFSFTLKLPQ